MSVCDTRLTCGPIGWAPKNLDKCCLRHPSRCYLGDIVRNERGTGYKPESDALRCQVVTDEDRVVEKALLGR